MSRTVRDDEIEEELHRLFGLDDPEISDDELEPEPENISDTDVSNILNGFNEDAVPMCNEIEVPFQMENEKFSSTSGVEDLYPEKSTPSASTSEILPPSSNLHLGSRCRRISSSSSEVPSNSDHITRTPLPESPTPSSPTSSLHLDSRRRRINSSSPEELSNSGRRTCLQESPGSNTLSDTDESDAEETEWKKVLWPQNPNLDFFDSVMLEARQFVPSRTRPVTYFGYFFDENVINLIVVQTNIYAQQQQSRGWTPVNSNEIKAFIGMIIMMGCHPLPAIDLYWSSDSFFRVNEIASVMTCKRFKKILENLHLNDNSKMPERGAADYDKLFKVRPLLDMLNTACQRSAKTTQSQSIDESMIKFKGISSLKQYMPLKPVKRGYKVWVRADSVSGYVFQFDVYTGKRDDHSSELGLGANVVKSLTQKLVDEGYKGHITFDNFFASYEIIQYLYDKGIYATSTVNSNRSDLPLVIKKEKSKTVPRRQKLNLDRGEFKWRTKKNVAFVMWQDTKIVTVLSSAFHPKLDKTYCDRKQKDGTMRAFQCPLTVLQYTDRMGGVDRFDHIRSTYEVGRRSKRWWLRIFYFCVDLAITNSFLLYKSNKRVHNPLSQLHFRLCLARGLINSFTSRKRSIESLAQHSKKRPKLSTNRQKVVGVTEEIRFSNVGSHKHERLDSWRRCRMCSTKTKNKRSKIQCSACKVPLCVVPCFDLFHSSI